MGASTSLPGVLHRGEAGRGNRGQKSSRDEGLGCCRLLADAPCQGQWPVNETDAKEKEEEGRVLGCRPVRGGGMRPRGCSQGG